MLIKAHCEFDFTNEVCYSLNSVTSPLLELGQRPIDVAGNEATKFILLKLHNEKAALERQKTVTEFAHQLLDLIFKSTPQEISTEVISYLQSHASNYPELLEYESKEV
jgi:hypothetical protein